MLSRRDFQFESFGWMTAICGVYAAMPEEKKAALLAWERDNLDGFSVRTSDWPGWFEYIGPFPKFTESQRKQLRVGSVYVVKSETNLYKIGRTKNVAARLNNFRVLAPFEFQLSHHFLADDCVQAERMLHQKYKDKRVKGEWFALSEGDLGFIRSIVGFSEGLVVRVSAPSETFAD
jgi:Meiotically up-regulated gene 113